MSQRKRKHQETPIPSDPTATWRSTVPPHKSFGFSRRRTKLKVNDEDEPSAGLKRFQKRPFHLAANRTTNASTNQEDDLEEGLGQAENPSTNDDEQGFQRIIPLGNSQQGNSHSSSPAGEKQTKQGNLPTGQASQNDYFIVPFAKAASKASLAGPSTTVSRTTMLPPSGRNSSSRMSGIFREATSDKPKQALGPPRFIQITTHKSNREAFPPRKESVYDAKNESRAKTFEGPSTCSNLPQASRKETKPREATPFVRSTAATKQELFAGAQAPTQSKTNEFIRTTDSVARESSAIEAPRTGNLNREKSKQREATPFPHSTASVATNKPNELFANTKTAIENRTKVNQVSSESIPTTDNVPRESSRGMKSHESLEFAKNDKQSGDIRPLQHHLHDEFSRKAPAIDTGGDSSSTLLLNDKKCVDNHHSHHHPHEEISKKEPAIDTGGDSSSCSLLTMANLLAHSGGKSSATDERSCIEERLDEEELKVPQTSLWRSETEATTCVMGLSPAAVFHERVMSVDEDLCNDNALGTLSKEDQLLCQRSDHLAFRDKDLRSFLEFSSDESDCDRRHAFRSPKPTKLIGKFNAVATSNAPTKPRKNPIRGKHNSTRNASTINKDARTTNGKNSDIPKFIRGETKKAKNRKSTRQKDSRIANHPSRYTTVALDEIIASALESQQKNQFKPNSTKRRKSKLEKTVSAASNKREPAFQRRDRSSVRPLRKRTKTIGNVQDYQELVNNKNARRISLDSLPQAKPQAPLSSAKAFCDGDISDWSADWDNLSIESIPRAHFDTDKASTNDSVSFLEDCPTDEKERKRAVPNWPIRKAQDGTRIPQSGFQDCPTDEKARKRAAPKKCIRKEKGRTEISNSKELRSAPPGGFRQNLPRAISNSRSSSGGTKKFFILSSHRQSIRLVLFLFYAYALFWVGPNPSNPIYLRNGSSNSSRIDVLEKHKQMLHPIRFSSKNPNFFLLQSSNTHEAPRM